MAIFLLGPDEFFVWKWKCKSYEN